ncbi:MAG TPA: hypothetical protein VE932_04970 [Patescibacteria group bacterium]|nr:hypothetical protein [Patescibacteria group bacterium]
MTTTDDFSRLDAKLDASEAAHDTLVNQKPAEVRLAVREEKRLADEGLARLRSIAPSAIPRLQRAIQKFSDERYVKHGGQAAARAGEQVKTYTGILEQAGSAEAWARKIRAEVDDLTLADIGSTPVAVVISNTKRTLLSAASIAGNVQQIVDTIPGAIAEMDRLIAWSPPVPPAGLGVLESSRPLPTHAVSSTAERGDG